MHNTNPKNDDVIHAGSVDSSATAPKSALRAEGAQRRDDRRASRMPDDSWIEVKIEVEIESGVRVIPHEVAAKRRPRPFRQHTNSHNECNIAKAPSVNRRKGQLSSKPDPSSMKGQQGQPTAKPDVPSTAEKPPSGTNEPATNDPDIVAGKCASSIFGARNELSNSLP